MSNSEKTRVAILKAAYDLLRESGLPAVSYSAIAETGGISRQLVRYYFKTSDELMYALCDQLAEANRQSILAGLNDIGERSRIEYLLDFFFDALEGGGKPDDDQVYDAMFSLAAGSEGLRENLRGQYTLLGEVVAHELGQEYPDLADQDASELAYLFVCIMYGHWKMVATLGFSDHHRSIARRSIDRLIASYNFQGSAEDTPPRVWKAKV